LSLDVTLTVVRGQTYVFTKYAALSRSGWGGNAEDDLSLARQARRQGFGELFAEHRFAWAHLWKSDIEIEGDARAQRLVHSELYYLLASSTAKTAWGIGACGLTTGYAGHIFWDSDTWIFPALLLLHPERAESLVDFRGSTLEPARQRARAHGLEGAMYPWESDPEQGTEQTPHSAFILGETEIHVNADVAIAQWQYYLATQNIDWLRRQGWPVIRDVARFWASRARYDPQRHRYEIVHVNSVAESHTDIPNDTFTNVSAARALSIATLAAPLVGERADPLWHRIATELYVPLSADGKRHLPFDPSVSGEAADFGGGTLSLLFLPSLDLPMADVLRRDDYFIAAPRSSLAQVADVSMGIAPRTIAAVTVGNAADAEAALAANFGGGTLKPPFNVRTESAGNNVGYFMTGSGGFVQSLIFGLAGLRIREQGLVQAYPPILPTGWQSMTLHNLRFRGQGIDIRIQRDQRGVAQAQRTVR
jgi:trehalose/maltose hydrolase-like predicted phosphorylase